MLRVRKGRVHAVGPHSAHIAGLPYACFLPPEQLRGASALVIAPRDGDEADHLVLQLADGGRAALTVTCASNALGITRPGDHAWSPTAHDAAVAAFAVAGAHCRLDGLEVARRMMAAASDAVCELVHALVTAQKLRDPMVVAVGGAAGGLGRHVAARMGFECTVPPGAEIISSIGDALSMVRAERERTVSVLTAEVVRELSDDAENEALAAGAAPGTVEVRIEEMPERGTVRAVATGTVGLRTGALPGQTLVTTVKGERTTAGELADTVARLTRYRGPVTLRPTIWLISAGRIAELASGDMISAALALHDPADASEVLVVGRKT
jgi:hypothetical protein